MFSIHSYKLRTVFMWAFTVIILGSALLFFVLAMGFTEKSVVTNSREYTDQLVRKVNDDIDSYIRYMNDISAMVYASPDIQDYFFGKPDSDDPVIRAAYEKDRSVARERVKEQFRTILHTRKDIRNIAVISESGEHIINGDNSQLNPYVSIDGQDWYQSVKADGRASHISTSHVQNVIYFQYDWVITLSRGLLNKDTGNAEGVFFIDLTYSTIDSLCRSVGMGKRGYIYVLDDKGNVIYHPKQQLLYSGLKDELISQIMDRSGDDAGFLWGKGNDRRLYTLSRSKETGWTVVGVSYMSEMMKEGKKLQRVYLMLAASFLVLGFWVARRMSKMITDPIVALDAAMKEAESGHFENAIVTAPVGQMEVRRLAESFNTMISRIQTLMEANMREQREKRKAEMRALQAQINPHFLYNTLDSIIWMAEGKENGPQVVEMTSALSKLLRQSIGNDDEIVPIARELDYIRTYLTIQAMRYRDRLSFRIRMEEDVADEQIVKLTLQPLVENAIYHGIKYSERPGTIEIEGYYEGSDVVIRIEDNGAGMTPETLSEILAEEPEGDDASSTKQMDQSADGMDAPMPDTGRRKKSKSSGIGVRNVQRRLRLYYGDGYGLTYESRPGEGTVVYVRIPAEDTAGGTR